MKTYTLYAIREVGEVAVIQANSKDEAIEKVESKDREIETDINWERTSVKEKDQSWESEDELLWLWYRCQYTNNSKVG